MTYSNDLKYAIINFYNKNKNNLVYPVTVIIKIFGVARSTFYNWLNEYNINPTFEKAQRKYFNDCDFKQAINKYITKYVKMRKSFNIKRITALIQKNFLISISKSTIYNILKTENITYKRAQTKISNKTKDQYAVNKKLFFKEIKKVDKNNIISIDEMSIEVNSKPNYGWSKKGEKCIYMVKKVQRFRYSIIIAVNRKEIISYLVQKGSINGELFKKFIMEDVLLSKHNNILLMDNARIHHYKKLKECMQENDNKIVYNIPYNPETNPVELVNNELKAMIKRSKTGTAKILLKTIHSCMRKLNTSNLEHYFKKSLKI